MRKAFNVLVASAIFLTGITPASAESFYFRYKTPVMWTPGSDPTNPTNPGAGLGEGNDVTIFFTGIIGKSFSKRIPVTTTDVVKWVVDTGSLQDGLVLEPKTGIVAGTPAGSTKKKVATLLGYDVEGRLIARANVTSTFRDVTGDTSEFTLYGHTNKYLYGKIPSNVSAIDHWTAFADLPFDFKIDGNYLGGTATAAGTTGIALVGNDYLGNEVTFTYGDLVIEDGPKVETIADQVRSPGQAFKVTAQVDLSIGDIKYRLIGLDGIPDTISFSTSKGQIGGSISTFSTSKRFQIEAMDVDGTKGLSNVFTLSTTGPDLSVADISNQAGVVGKAFALQLSAGEAVGQTTWSIKSGSLPDGIDLNPDTGEISGTPLIEQEQPDIVVAIEDSAGTSQESNPFTFKIFATAPEVSFKPVDIRVGESFVSSGPTFGEGVVKPYEFKKVESFQLDEALTVDYPTAVVSGTATESGDLSVPFKFVNGDKNETSVTQSVTAHDPLSLEYPEVVTVYRRVPAAVPASYDPEAVIGLAKFALSAGEMPEGLSIDPTSGNIVGSASAIDRTVDIQAILSDDSGDAIKSNVFEIDVQDRPAVTVNAQSPQVERYVDNSVIAATAQNIFDGVTYELVQGSLPEGLELGSDGVITGVTTAALGKYDGFQIKATDGEGYSALSDTFSITVKQPADLVPLTEENATARWTKEVPFALPLPRPANAFGAIQYKVDGLPSGVSLMGDSLVGTVQEKGVYSLPMVLADDSGRALLGTFRLVILDPMTASLEGSGKQVDEENDAISFELPRGAWSRVGPKLVDAIEPVVVTMAGTPPSGIFFNADKRAASGIPANEGASATVSFTVRDAAGTEVTLDGTLKVVARLPIALSYDPKFPAGNVGKAIEPITPIIENAIGDTAFFVVGGELPPGIKLDPATGYFTGKPTKNGSWPDVAVMAIDSEGSSFAGNSGPFEIGIQHAKPISLASTTILKVRAARAFTKQIPVQNVTAPFGFSSSQPLANGLNLSEDGKVSGTLFEEKVYDVGSVTVRDYFNDSKTTQLKVSAVGRIVLYPPNTTYFNAWSQAYTKAPVYNAIGSKKFEIVAGQLPAKLTLNETTGEISGRPEVEETRAGIVMRVTDETGETEDSKPFTLQVGPRLPLKIATQASYDVIANTTFKLKPSVTNAVDSSAFAITSGKLPEGLSFSPDTGLISGKAVELGNFPITVEVTDGIGAKASAQLVLKSATKGAIVLAVTDFATKAGMPFQTVAPTYSNHIGNVAFSSDLDLGPYGLSLDPATGVVTGVVDKLLDITPNISITDETKRITSRPIRIQVVPDLAIEAPETIDRVVNVGISPSIVVNSKYATASVVWTLGGTLPKGMTFSGYFHKFSGTPTEMGSFDVVLTAREISGARQVATKKVTIKVVSDGLSPSISVTPGATGYYTFIANKISYKVTNAKRGMKLSLSPDSKPLPHGLWLDNTGDVPVIRKNDDAVLGLFEGLRVRITNPDGLYADSNVFAVAFTTNLKYPDVTLSTAAYQPVNLPTATPSVGQPMGNTLYSFSGSNLGSTLAIDGKTGAISGHVTKSGTATVSVKNTYNGATLPSASYKLTVKATQVLLDAPATQASYTGIDIPAYPATVTNGLPGFSLSVEGVLPQGLSFDPQAQKLVGVASEAGTFSVELVYADQYQSVRKPFRVVVEKAADASNGYKFVKIEKIGSGLLHMRASMFNQTGQSVQNMVECAAGSPGGNCAKLMSTNNWHADYPNNGSNVIAFPTFVSGGKLQYQMHGSATVAVSVSADGTTWREVHRRTISGYETNDAPFTYVEQVVPLTLDVTPLITKVGRQFHTETPNVGGAKTGVRFYTNDDLSGTNLKIDPETGVISGSFDSALKRNVSLSVTDDTKRQATKAVSIQIVPTMTLKAAESTTVTVDKAMASITVTRSNAYGTATWDSVDASLLPTGVIFNTTLGRFEGTPKTLGTYGPILVTSRDSLDDVGSVFVTIVVKDLSGFAFKLQSEQGLPTAYKRQPYRVDLKSLLTDDSDPAVVNAITFKWSYNDLVANFPNHNSDLILTGSVIAGAMKNSGRTTVNITASYGGFSKMQVYDFVSEIAPISMSLQSDSSFFGPYTNGVAPATKNVQDILTTQNIDKATVRWAIRAPSALGTDEISGFPTGLSVNATTGLISGTPTVNGKFRFVLAATFTDTRKTAEAAEATQEYTAVTTGVKLEFKSLAVGTNSACGIGKDNAVYCWGSGANGRLGQGSTDNYLVPTKVAGIVGVPRQISVENTACVVTESNTMYCWGYNEFNQVTSSNTTDQLKPVASSLGATVKSVSVGNSNVCALTTDTGLKCWGNNDYGKIFLTEAKYATPTTIVASGVKGVSAKGGFSCFDLADGTAKCAGYAWDGRLGQGSGSGSSSTPLLVKTSANVILENIRETSLSGGGGCHIVDDGSIYCHGRGQEGASGNGTWVSNLFAAKVPGLSDVKKVAGTTVNSFCALTEGTVKCWGSNSDGQLGSGVAGNTQTTNRNVPTQVDGLTETVVDIAGGGTGMCALYISGRAACWGAGWTIGNGAANRRMSATIIGG